MFSFNFLTMNIFGVSVIPKTASAMHRMLGAASTAIDSYGNPIFQCCLALTHNVGNPGYHKQTTTMTGDGKHLTHIFFDHLR